MQSEAPLIPLSVNNVCVRDLEVKLCLVNLGNHLECHVAQVSACVDLDRSVRGIHVSRSVESILNTVSSTVYTDLFSLQRTLKTVAEILLAKHEYSSKATVKLKVKLLYAVGCESIPVALRISVKLNRSGHVKYSLSVRVKGMTVCPCAQQVYAHVENIVAPSVPSHSQRTLLTVRVDSSTPINPDLGELVNMLLSSFSTSIKSFLKRSEEYRLVKRAFENPKFAEDVAREAVYRVYKALRRELNSNGRITARVVSYESLHPFNLYVEINHSVRDLDDVFSGSTGVVE